jgi:glycosyltransferase involved in cell wall biosynthesis
MPVYNEARTLREIVARVLAAPLDKELVAVDDGSTDGSGDILRELASARPDSSAEGSAKADVLRVVTLAKNSGKGAAVRAGFAEAKGDILVVQDADLEYDPEDLPRLLAAMSRPGVDVVYGSRITGHTPRGYAAFYVGGILVSLTASLLFRAHVSDEPTCYKMFRRTLLDTLKLECAGFEFCAEFTAKALRRGCVIRDVPIRYHARSLAEGKKITWRDGLKAIATLLRIALAR